MEEFLDLKNLGNLITLISIICTIAGGVFTFFWKIYKKLREIYDKIMLIAKELTPNGGSSLKDQCNRIELRLNGLDFFQKMYLDIVDMPIFMTDGNGHCTWANRAYLNMLGKQVNDIIGSGWETVIHQEDRDRVTQEWYESIKEERPFDLQCRYVTSDDSVIVVRCKASGSIKTGYFGILSKIRVIHS